MKRSNFDWMSYYLIVFWKHGHYYTLWLYKDGGDDDGDAENDDGDGENRMFARECVVKHNVIPHAEKTHFLNLFVPV